jgi:hypothetical protein
MSIDEKECEEIEKRMVWYEKAFSSEEKEDQDQNEDEETIESFLTSFETRLHKQPLHMCVRQPICKCLVKRQDCDCDSDNYSTSINVRGEMNNLCRYSIQVCFEGKLKIKSDFKSILRFFYFGKTDDTLPDNKESHEEKEVILFDIVPLKTRREDEINSFDIIIYLPAAAGNENCDSDKGISSADNKESGSADNRESSGSIARKFPIQDINFNMSILDISFNYLMDELL